MPGPTNFLPICVTQTFWFFRVCCPALIPMLSLVLMIILIPSTGMEFVTNGIGHLACVKHLTNFTFDQAAQICQENIRNRFFIFTRYLLAAQICPPPTSCLCSDTTTDKLLHRVSCCDRRSHWHRFHAILHGIYHLPIQRQRQRQRQMFPCHSTRYISSSYSKIKTKTNVSMPFYTVDIMSLILTIFIVPKFMTAQCTSLHNCNHHNLDDFAIKVCIIIIIIIILAYQGVRPCGLLARWAWAHPLWSLVTLLNQFHASIIGHLIFHMLSAQVI